MANSGSSELPNSGDTLDDIVRAYARAKIQKMDILNYNGANLAYNHAVSTANNLGLNPAQKLGISPFPASNTSVNVIGGDPVSTPQQSQAGAASQPTRGNRQAPELPKFPWWIPAAVSAVTGAGIAVGAMNYLGGNTKPPATVEVDSGGASVGLEVDGVDQWK